MKPEQTIVNTLAKLKVPEKAYPWIVAQAAHESAGFKSKLFKLNFNAFGMKLPKRRPTTATGPGIQPPSSEGATPYAAYKSLEDSVADLNIWLQYNKIPWTKINSESDYAGFLFKKGYFGDTFDNYLKGLRYWMSRIKIPKPVIIGLPVLLLGALALYILSK